MKNVPTDTFAVEHCNCLSLRRAARLVSNFYDARLAPIGLRTSQYSILLAVRDNNPISINDLATVLDLERTTAGQNLRPLERAGLVILERSAADRRSWVVSLTQLGALKLSEATPLWRDAQAAFEHLNGSEPSADLRDRLSTLAFA